MFPQNLSLHHHPNLSPVWGSLSFCLLWPPSIPMPQTSAEAAPHPPVRMGSEFQWAIITSLNIMQNTVLCPQASQRAAHSFLSHRLHNKVGKCANLKGTPTTQGSLPILQSPATRRTVTSQGPLGRVTEMQFPLRVPQRKASAPRAVPSSCHTGSWPAGVGCPLHLPHGSHQMEISPTTVDQGGGALQQNTSELCPRPC